MFKHIRVFKNFCFGLNNILFKYNLYLHMNNTVDTGADADIMLIYVSFV